MNYPSGAFSYRHPTPPTLAMRLPSTLIATFLLLWSTSMTVASQASAQAARGRAREMEQTCRMDVLDSSLVRWADDYRAYVEPSTVVPGKSSTLIAGSPTYLSKSSVRGSPSTQVLDSVFGAIRLSDGSWTPVPRPAGIRYFGGVRAISSGKDRWDVMFVELPGHANQMQGPDTTLGVWHGRLGLQGWESLERVPVEYPHHIGFISAPALLGRRDTLTWAIHVRGEGLRVTGDAEVLRRIDGKWEHRRLGRFPLRIATATLGDGQHRLFLRHERVIGDKAEEVTAFRTFPDVQELETLLPQSSDNRYLLRADTLAGGSTALSWLKVSEREREFRAIVLDASGRSLGERVLRGDLSQAWVLYATRWKPSWLMLADNRQGVASGAAGGRFELFSVSESRQRRVGTLSHRYIGTPELRMLGPYRILASGPVVSTDATGTRLETLLTTIGVHCRDLRTAATH